MTGQFATRFSERNREAALANMAPPERKGWIQTPIAILLLFSPVACLILAMVHSSSQALQLRLLVLALPLVALGLYAFYRSGVSVYSDIRVDLLLIYPALFLAFLFWPALLVSSSCLAGDRRTRAGERYSLYNYMQGTLLRF